MTITSTRPAVQSLDITELVDGQHISPFLIGVVVLGFLAQIGDGYDLAAAAYAAPGIVRSWHVNSESLAPIFSLTPFGMMLGAPAFGYIGDRFGRRGAIIFCSLLLGASTLVTAGTQNLIELGVLRFITGLGLGGLPANTIAITAEYAPRRSRALIITLMFMGTTVGGAIPAVVTFAGPAADWQLLFIVGGVMPVVAAVLNLIFLPESLKFLGLRNAFNPKLAKIARRMRPDVLISDKTEFRFPRQSGGHFALRMLFVDRLRFMTPLIWTIYIAIMMTNFFLSSWMPTLFRAAGLSAIEATTTTSLYSIGGVIGGIAISLALDRTRLGIGIVAIFMSVGGPAVMLLGVVDVSALKFAVLFVGIFVLGSQLGVNAVLGIVYPTAIRANGSGWAFGIGRFGAMLGPLIGGALIAWHVKPQYLFMVPTAPLLIGALAALMIKIRSKHGIVPDEVSLAVMVKSRPSP